MDFVAVVSAVAAWIAALTAIVVGRSTVAQAEQTRTQMRAQHVDSLAPMVTVELRQPDWPPYEPSVAYNGLPNPLTGELAQWRLPGHAQRNLMIVAKAHLRNIGASPALIELGTGGRILSGEPDDPDVLANPPLGTDADRIRRHRLDPGNAVWAFFSNTRTVAEWARISQLPGEDALGEVCISIRIDDIFDFGMTDSLSVALRASPLVNSASDAGLWRLRDPHLTMGTKQFLSATATPVKRLYWESRSRNSVLRGDESNQRNEKRSFFFRRTHD